MEEKKKAKTWIATAGVAVLVILLIGLFTVLAVTSTSPKQSIEGMLTNLKAGEFEKAQEFITGDDELLDSAEEFDVEIQKSLFDKLTWKIISIEKVEDNATIEIEITNKDLKTIAKQVIKDAVANEKMSKEDLEVALEEALRSDEVATSTVTATLQAVKEDKKWKIQANEELETALMPAFEDVINSIKAIDIVNTLT